MVLRIMDHRPCFPQENAGFACVVGCLRRIIQETYRQVCLDFGRSVTKVMNGLTSTIVTYGRMIKFSHSVFALPFALSGAVLAAAKVGISSQQVFWIVLAMVGARSAAMGFNRLVDRRIDEANPRTRNRELAQGLLSPPAVGIFVVLSSLVLVFSAYNLNRLCFYLSPLALAIVFFYSYTKRYTWATHLFLGLSLSLAPIGAWIAVTDTLDAAPLILGLAVLMWVSGFDVIYACQDYEFDTSNKLCSIPQRFGIRWALITARIFHIISLLLLLSIKALLGLNSIYIAGVIIVGAVLIYEHSLVKSDDLSKVNVAFFNMNGIISILYFAFTLGDILYDSNISFFSNLLST